MSESARVATILSLLVTATVAQVILPAGVCARPSSRPNIVLILADDLGYGDIGCYNAKSKIATPNVDRLAADGLRFDHAYSAAAVCVPSRYGLLTGRYPFRGHPLRWTTHPTIAEGQMTLGSMLQNAGYLTACVGKWHCGFDGGVARQDRPLTGGPLDRGFHSFFGQHGSLDQPPYFYIRDRRAVMQATEDTLDTQDNSHSVVYQGRFWRGGKIAPDFKHEEVLDRYADEALAFLRGRDARGAAGAQSDADHKPFFLYLPLTAPHGPWLPAEEFRGKSQAGPLGDFVMQVDDVVGRVLKTLDDCGHRDDTLVIFSSDNGPLWFDGDVERYGHDSSGGLRGRKGDIWEGGFRMPLIARWPGHVPAGAASNEIVGLVDLLATLAAVVGEELPDDAAADSVNMLPALLGERRDRPIREALLLQSLGPNDLAIRQGPWKLIPWLGSGGFLTKPSRVKPAGGEPSGQLYNLDDDPGEQHNLYAQHPEIVAKLSALLEKYRTSEQTRPAEAKQQPAAGAGPSRRVPWTSSRINGTPEPPSEYATEPVFAGLAFERPAEMVAIPGTNRLAVVEVKGHIYSFDDNPLGDSAERDLFADLSKVHKDFYRAYGLTFHLRFEENRYCYVSYVLQPKTPDGTRVSRFTVTDADPPRLDLDSEQVLVTWLSGGHNGGHLQFGPDGYLYISTGDGSDPFPPDSHNTGQDISDLLSSVLRIDVDRADSEHNLPYAIPADNPFVGVENARGEVWAYGLRNPWKMCFDPADGSLWVADVGWEMWEMLYRVERGGNYGWSLVEASQPVHLERQRGPTPILPPTVEHSHTEARSITGGYFYQSPRLEKLRGAYVYGDYVTGKVWALRHDAGKITWHDELVDTPLQIVSFGQDRRGEVYLVDYGGTIHRLVPNPRRGANQQFPRRLSETGLFASVKDQTPAAGVIPYGINAEPWADGTTAERFVALPGETKLGVYKESNVQVGYIAGEWQFPSDSVLAKTVSIGLEPGNASSRRRIETQILHFDVDTWRAYNYIWNDQQTDAVLAPDKPSTSSFEIRDPKSAGATRRQTWRHASRGECILCHTTRAGTVHGFNPPQLDRDCNFGGAVVNQLADFDRIGLFAEPLPEERTVWPDPYGSSADLASRARAYLHVNCGHCHRRGGGGTAALDVRFENPLEKANLIEARPTQGTFGIYAPRVVAAGDPFRSVLYYRMAKLGPGRMPHFGSQVVDRRGLRLMRDWIAALPNDSDATQDPTRRLRDRQQAALRQLVSVENDDTVDRDAALKLLLSSPSGALMLVSAIDDGQLSGGLLLRAIERGAQHEDARIRDLFERFVPEEQRVQRLGAVVDPAQILSTVGDAERGRTLFVSGTGVQCRNCHRVANTGRELGPDLAQIGKKYDRAKLLESLLEPSKVIDPKFVTYLVETTAGHVHTGLLVRRSDDEIVLRDAEGKEIRVAAEDVEFAAPQQKSLMPDLLLKDLTLQQVADLLEFLASQR